MDQVYGFFIPAQEVLVVNPRTDIKGLLELHSVGAEDGAESDGVLWLFRGSLTVEECQGQITSGVKSARTTFLIGANKYKYGAMIWDGNESSFTIFAELSTRGYVRLLEPPRSC